MSEPMALVRTLWINWFFVLWMETIYFPDGHKTHRFWLETTDELKRRHEWLRNLAWREYDISDPK